MSIEPKKVDYGAYAYKKNEKKRKKANGKENLVVENDGNSINDKRTENDYSEVIESNEVKLKAVEHIILDERSLGVKRKGKKEKKQNIYDKKIKKKESYGFKFLVLILLVVVILLICITGVSVKKLNDKVLLSSRGSMKYYAVEMFESPDFDSAHVFANALRKQGGGGFVVKRGENYSVYASCYTSEKDAKSVLNKLIVDGNECKLVELVVPFYPEKDYGLNYNVFWEEAMTYCNMIYTNLFEISNNLDLKKISEVEAQNKILMVMERTKVIRKGLDEIEIKKQDERMIKLKVEIDAAVGIMDNLTNNNLVRPNLICDIRYTYLVIINNYIMTVRSFGVL